MLILKILIHIIKLCILTAWKIIKMQCARSQGNSTKYHMKQLYATDLTKGNKFTMGPGSEGDSFKTTVHDWPHQREQSSQWVLGQKGTVLKLWHDRPRLKEIFSKRVMSRKGHKFCKNSMAKMLVNIDDRIIIR